MQVERVPTAVIEVQVCVNDGVDLLRLHARGPQSAQEMAVLAWEEARALTLIELGADPRIHEDGLAARADQFLAENPLLIDSVRRLFTLRLAHVPRQGEPVRRRMLYSHEREDEWRLVQRLAGPDWRLLVTGEADGIAAAEVAHEVLLRTWPTLKRWLDDEREFLIWRDDVVAHRRIRGGGRHPLRKS